MKTSVIFFSWLLISVAKIYGQDTNVRLNDIRILASHNSYKKLPHPKVVKFLSRFKKRLGEENNPIQLDYGHLPIETQMSDYNIRGLELDVYYDPKGSLYRKRKINRFIIGQKVKVRDEKMKQPGFKLLHIPDIDFETNYLTFIDALKSVKSWSKNNPNHSPIFINVEVKGTSAADESKFLRILGFKRAIPMDSLAFISLNNEILSVFSDGEIYKPIQLQSNYNCIKDRIFSEGWPLLSECMGKIFFILQGNNEDIYRKILQNDKSLCMFAYDEPGASNTAFVIRNNSKNKEREIGLLSDYYIIRTRTDAGTIQARNNDYSDFVSALKSNAQIISTDYYKPDQRFSDFKIILKGMDKTRSYIYRN
jgi:hypothetical protein